MIGSSRGMPIQTRLRGYESFEDCDSKLEGFLVCNFEAI